MYILRRIIDSPVHSKDFPSTLSKGAWQGLNMASLDNPPHNFWGEPERAPH